MNKHAIYIFSILIAVLLSVLLSGCEELDKLIEEASEPDYIIVNIESKAVVYTLLSSGIEEHIADITVMIEMAKAGGETFTFYKTTDEYGYTETVTGSFNLYNEQDVGCTARPTGIGSWTNIPISSKTLSWETVDATCDFGDIYTWTVSHSLTISEGQG